MAAAVATGVVAMMMDAGGDRKVAASYDDVVLALLNAESDAGSESGRRPRSAKQGPTVRAT